MGSSIETHNLHSISTRELSHWQLSALAMSAEEYLPFIPQGDGSVSSPSTTSLDLASTLDAEKGGLNQVHDYQGIVLGQPDLSPSQRSRAALIWARLSTYSRHIILGALTLLALSLGVIAIMRTASRSSPPSPSRIPGFEYTSDGRLLSCGNTFEEAERVGCKFDVMTFVYTPPACYDEEMAQNAVDDASELALSRATGTWPWWRYENHTEPLEQSVEVLSSTVPVWTNNVYHRAHCLYLWRVSHRAMTRVAEGQPGGVYVYQKMTDWAHVVHCNKLLNNMEKPEDWPAQAVKKIGTCVRLDSSS